MFDHFPLLLQKIIAGLKHLPVKLWYRFVAYWQRNIWHKFAVIVVCLAFVSLAGMYGIARWYMASQAHKPLVLGTSFIPAYAESLGLEPKAAMQAMIDDLGIRHFRLVSYWSQIEPTEGVYDFSILDWQFKKAEAANAKVSLSIGLRQPRWPECHQPEWAAGKSVAERQPRLEQFMSAVINRYKDSPSLESYQLENEFFLKGFGLCTNWDRERLVNEFKLVKQLDPHHPVIVSRSNNAIGTPVGAPTPDEFGVSVYKRVWSAPIKRYLEYPFPAWYYGFLGGVQKMTTGKDMMIHELQAEAWTPRGQQIAETSLDEQNKSLDAKRLEGRFRFAEGTGAREVYFWGSEYWYYRMVKLNDPSLWNVARDEFRQR